MNNIDMHTASQMQGLNARKHPVKHPLMQPTAPLQQEVVTFGSTDKYDTASKAAYKAARKAESEDIAAMAGAGKKEGPWQGSFRAFVPLNFISQIKTKLTPESETRMAAYGELTQLALRDKRHATPESEAAVRAKLENPSEPLKKWMQELNLTSKDLVEPVADYSQIDNDAFVPPEVFQRMANIGLFRLKVPKEIGGLGFSFKEYARAMRGLSHTTGALTAIVSAHSTIGGAVKLGTPEQQKKYFRDIAEGKYLAAFALTEPGGPKPGHLPTGSAPGGGTDVAGMKTVGKLSPDGKHWILNGEKIFITNTHRSGVMWTFAKTDIGSAKIPLRRKQTAFVVELPFRLTDTKEDINRKRAELAKQGLIISDPLQIIGIRGSNQAHIQFKDYKIPFESVLGGVAPQIKEDGTPKVDADGHQYLGKIGAGISEPLNALNSGRAGFGPTYSESANIMFELALERAKQQKMFRQYGGTQADIPDVQQKLAVMAMKSAALQATEELITAYVSDYEKDGYSVVGEAAMIKVVSTLIADEISNLMMDVLGGASYMKDHPSGAERIYRDTKIGLTVEGVTGAMKNLATGNGLINMGKDELLDRKRIDLWLKNQITGCVQTGGLGLSDADWLHSRAGQLNFKFLAQGMKHMRNPQAFENAQDVHNKMFDIAAGIVMLAAVQMKLKKDKTLSAAERTTLKGYVKIAKHEIDNNLRDLQAWRVIPFSIVKDVDKSKVMKEVAKAWLDAPAK